MTGSTVEHHPADRTARLRSDLPGDFNGDGRAEAALMYDHGDDNASLSTLLAEPDGTVGEAVHSWARTDAPPGRAGPGRAGPGRAGPGRAGPGRAGSRPGWTPGRGPPGQGTPPRHG
ncbi:hypothetical protein [Streptomyces sp. NBC_00211]|uniref:hypothetical protein n=1 Tax=Streptomyces sp. NBC_00211 TaxID=2975683 RepID=UPI00324DF53F